MGWGHLGTLPRISVNSTTADGTKFVYTYDQRHRVRNGTLKDSGNNLLRTFGYTYDVADNLTAKTRTVTSPYSSDSWVYGYDNANQQTSVTLNGGTPETRSYDDWGRMATRTQGASSATFGYRYGGRLYSYATNFGGETPETMQYRGDGRLYYRNAAGTIKVYRYDAGWNAINEEDNAGNLTATSVYAPTSEVGERLAYAYGALATTPTFYAYHDQLGSTRVWRWQSKALFGSNDFGPYGEKYASSGTSPALDYALHVQDPYTGLYHAPYREYATGWARWTTRDPLGMVDGPNEYGYVGGRPVRWRDPHGLYLYPNGPFVDFKPHPNGAPGESCLSKAYDIAWNSRGRTGSMRHCVAICEARRCLGTAGAYSAQTLNWVLEKLYGGTDKEDSQRDIEAGADALNIPVSGCEDDGYCTSACLRRGW